MEDLDNATPVDLYTCIRQACDQLEPDQSFSSAEEQIRFVLGQGWHPQLAPFKAWCRQVASVLRSFEENNSIKNIDIARQYKQMADVYLSMVDKEFVDKAFAHLAKAIIWAPFSEAEFLFDCFMARSELHQRNKDYNTALVDIERALTFQAPTVAIIQRKVTLLKRLERGNEAYWFVKDFLNDRTAKYTLSTKDKEMLRFIKRELKRFKRSTKKKQENNAGSLPDHHIEMDSRLNWEFDQVLNRYVLKAAESIPSELDLLKEDPALFVVRSDSLKTHCNLCATECANSFVPCSRCTEVIFCSDDCVKRANSEHHRLECGIIGAMTAKSVIPPQVLQVYRHLARTGHHDLIKLHHKTKAGYLPDFNQLIGAEKMARTKAQSLFAHSASTMHHQIIAQQALRSASELVNAIYMMVIYCYKANIKQMDPIEMFQLIQILATDMVRTNLTEYGWFGTSPDDENKKVHIGNYQCLVGSRVSHNCQPNVEWRFDDRRFYLKTIKAIEPGDEIAITFGPNETQPLFTRLAQVVNFWRMCHCKLCLKQSNEHFAIRCTYCNGPIPFESGQFMELKCLLCEKKFQHGLVNAKVIQADFHATQRTVWLIQGVDEPETSTAALEQIEKRVTALSNAMHTKNKQLLSLVKDLCHEYIRREMYGLAVEWFQWFSQLSISLAHSDNQDLLARLHELEQWAQAYLAYLPSLSAENEKTGQYIAVCKSLLQQMSAIIKKLPNSGFAKILMLSDEQFEDIVQALRDRVDQKWHKFEEICPAASKEVDKSDKPTNKLQTVDDLQGELA